ncbi:MAG: sugar phosphate isomerase/epimerase family protein [Eubacteriales bacterium]
MKLGICTDPRDLSRAEKLRTFGYDYIECGFAGLAGIPAETLKDTKRSLDSIGIACLTCNGLFKGETRLTGEGVDDKEIYDWLSAGFEKASLLGVDRVVFGSGTARNVPDGFDRDTAFAQLAHMLSEIASPLARDYGIRIAIEPLRRAESNIINSTSEGLSLAGAANRDNVGLLCDLYHAAVDGDDMSCLRDCGCLFHTHIANPVERKIPSPQDSPESLATYASFFAILKGAGYNEGVSIEAGVRSDFLSECEAAAGLLRGYME